MPATIRMAENARPLLVLVVALCISSIQIGAASAVQDPPSYDTKPIAQEYTIPAEQPNMDAQERAAWSKQRSQVNTRIRTTRTAVSNAMQSAGGISDPTQFEAWFNGYVFPSMTQTDSKSLENLGKARREFFRAYLQKAPQGAARTKLIEELTIPEMKEIIEGNYHPAVRVNAMVLLSLLKVAEGDRSSRRLPISHTDNFRYMVASLDNDALTPEVKVAALAGIHEHVLITPGMSGGDKRQLADRMVEFINNAPEDWPKPIVQWIQRRAVQVIGDLKDAGDGAKYAAVLRDVMADKDQYVWTRVDAIDAYSKLAFADPDDRQVVDTAKTISELVVYAARRDASYINATINHMKNTAMMLDGIDISEAEAESSSVADPGLGRGVGIEQPNQPTGDQEAAGSSVPEVLPAYQRNMVRRRFKTIAYTGRVAMVGKAYNFRDEGATPEGLCTNASQEEVDLILQLASKVDSMVEQANVKHEERQEGEPEDTETLADKLVAVLNQGADSLQQVLNENSGDPVDGDSSESGGQ